MMNRIIERTGIQNTITIYKPYLFVNGRDFVFRVLPTTHRNLAEPYPHRATAEEWIVM